MTNAHKRSGISTVLLAVFSLLSLLAAQEKKQFSCTVGPGAVISITNNYGPITVKPSGSNQVLVETIFHSDAVNLVNEQHGNRIELRSISSRHGTNLVEYSALVPAAALSPCDRPMELCGRRVCAAMSSSKPPPVRWK